jgi:hypothetical protein
MMKKIILTILIIGVLSGVYMYFFMYNKSHPDYANMDADIKISAQDLFQDSQNGNALKYTGKLLEVMGSPSKLEISDSIYTLVYVFDEGMFGPEGIRANFLVEYAHQLQDLSYPKEITIKAYCTGFNDTDVILEKAIIVQP